MSHVIHVFLEGEDDERFLNKIIKPELLKKYSKINIFKYAQTPRPTLEKFVAILKNSHATYIFFSDMDRATCYTKRKARVKSKTVKNIDSTKVIIAKAEIESWYLAGLDQHNATSLNIQHFRNTENITKEDFNRICKKYTSRIYCMTIILEKFSLDIAKTQNKSFKYFCDKFL